MIACAVGCAPSEPPVRVTGDLSSNDVVQIQPAVRQEMSLRLHSASGHPIKSVAAATMTTHPVVEVWYADKGARWGEAGYFVEKTTNDWKVTVELFR